MTGTIFEIKRFAVHDGDGIRTTVFLKGCPLKCVWCHNPEGISFQHQTAYLAHKCISCGECVTACPAGCHSAANGIHTFHRDNCTACGICSKICFGEAMLHYGEEKTVEELMPLLLEDRVFYGDTGGVTLSGGECLMQGDFCLALLKKLKAEGINTAVDTCGHVPWETVERVVPYTDMFLYDIKAFTEETHLRCTGRSNRLILENLRRLDRAGANLEIRIPCVPGYNLEEMPAIAALLSSLSAPPRVRLLPCHNYAGAKYASLGLENTMPSPLFGADDMEQLKALFSSFGLTVL